MLSSLVAAHEWIKFFISPLYSFFFYACSGLFSSRPTTRKYYLTVIAPGNILEENSNNKKRICKIIYCHTFMCEHVMLSKNILMAPHICKCMHVPACVCLTCVCPHNEEEWSFELSANCEGLTLCDSQKLHAENKRLIIVTGLELRGCWLDACDNVWLCSNIQKCSQAVIRWKHLCRHLYVSTDVCV